MRGDKGNGPGPTKSGNTTPSQDTAAGPKHGPGGSPNIRPQPRTDEQPSPCAQPSPSASFHSGTSTTPRRTRATKTVARDRETDLLIAIARNHYGSTSSLAQWIYDTVGDNEMTMTRRALARLAKRNLILAHAVHSQLQLYRLSLKGAWHLRDMGWLDAFGRSPKASESFEIPHTYRHDLLAQHVLGKASHAAARVITEYELRCECLRQRATNTLWQRRTEGIKIPDGAILWRDADEHWQLVEVEYAKKSDDDRRSQAEAIGIACTEGLVLAGVLFRSALVVAPVFQGLNHPERVRNALREFAQGDFAVDLLVCTIDQAYRPRGEVRRLDIRGQLPHLLVRFSSMERDEEGDEVVHRCSQTVLSTGDPVELRWSAAGMGCGALRLRCGMDWVECDVLYAPLPHRETWTGSYDLERPGEVDRLRAAIWRVLQWGSDQGELDAQELCQEWDEWTIARFPALHRWRRSGH